MQSSRVFSGSGSCVFLWVCAMPVEGLLHNGPVSRVPATSLQECELAFG